LVEQQLHLRSHARVDLRQVGPLRHAEQRQAALGRHDVLAVGPQEILRLEAADDLGAGRRRADALGLL
jgi:hypothetical protein